MILIRDARVHADRPESSSDAVACARIYEPYVSASAISFELVPPPAPVMAERIRDAQRGHAWLIAEIDSEVVGYAYGHPFAERAAYRWSCEVSVYVGAESRGRQVGRTLYEELLGRLGALGYRAAFAGISQPNDASNGLHLALGFEQCGLFRAVGHKLDEWRDVAWFRRDLGAGSTSPPCRLAHID